MLLLCHPIPQGHTVKAQCYKSFLQYHFCSVSGEKYPELVENAVVLMLQATQWTLLRMFSGSAGRK